MGKLVILTADGDETISWKPEDADSTVQAKKRYDELKAQGYEFYEVKDGRGPRIKRWNKKLGEIIAAPGVQSEEDKESGERDKAMSGGPNAWLAI